MKKLIVIFLLTTPITLTAQTVEYFKVVNGKITLIQMEDFDSCSEIIYRNNQIGESLPIKYKKRLLKAILKGKTIENLKTIATKEQACSYKTRDEKIN